MFIAVAIDSNNPEICSIPNHGINANLQSKTCDNCLESISVFIQPVFGMSTIKWTFSLKKYIA